MALVWDVVVVGAGPAGAAAALGALQESPEARVLLLDRDPFPRDKVCGDGVAPHVLDVLESLGAGDTVADLTRRHTPVHTLQLSLGGQEVTRRMRRPALVVPREVLDARLVEAAVAAGAELRRHRVRSVVVGPREVVLDETIRARVVVAADGASSDLRRLLGWRHPGRTAIGIRGYAPTPPSGVGRQVIRFGADRQPSYAWAFDRGDGWSNVGYGEVLSVRLSTPTRALMMTRIEELLPGSTSGAHSWRGHQLPLSSARWTHPEGRVLLTGDAAGLVNPLTGEGIYYAVLTGGVAGRIAARRARGYAVGPPPDPGSEYRRAVQRLLRANLASTALAGRLASTPTVLSAGLRAADRHEAVFDDLVELGLGRGTITPRVVAGLVGQVSRAASTGERAGPPAP